MKFIRYLGLEFSNSAQSGFCPGVGICCIAVRKTYSEIELFKH